MQLDDPGDQGEADPGPLVLVTGMEPLEDHEDPVEVLGLDPDPVVLHREPPGPAVRFRRDTHPRRDSLAVELERVAHQVGKDLAELGYEVIDVGTQGKDAVDYPDFAAEVARLVGTGKAWRGVMIDGAGIGSCMVANKVPGVRAAMCYDDASAVNSREHNDANVLTLGAGLIGVSLARRIMKIWLATDFGGGRHAGRVNKIIAVEKQYFK